MAAQGDKRITLDDGSNESLAATLLSGDSVTAFINTDGVRRAARIAIEGIALEPGFAVKSQIAHSVQVPF